MTADRLLRSHKHPIYLDVHDRPVVVLGGGTVAERRIRSLLDAGARVTVVAPVVTAAIEGWVAAGDVRLERRRYLTGDLRGARLAYAATGDDEANRAARQEADAEGIWLNAADRPLLCDFFEPAVVRRGHLSIAISTGGASPALAARLRRKLQAEIGPEFAEVLTRLASLRARCREEGRPLSEVRQEIERLIDEVLPRGR